MRTVLEFATLFLLLLAAVANAAPSVVCFTRMGSTPVDKVPTSTKTVTATLRPTLTVEARSTVTRYSGATYTYTWLTTKTVTTTDPVETDTYTSTSIEIETQVVPVPITITSTSTDVSTVSYTSTTTIATTQGFRNIRDTLNSKSFRRRALPNPRLGMSPAKRAAKQGVAALTNPARVDCTTTIPNTNTLTVTKRVAPVTVTTSYWAVRTTETSTVKTTSTIVPARVTVTETVIRVSTLKVSTTTFSTETQRASSTATALFHGPTVWNACNPQNYFGPNFKHNANDASFDYYVNNVNNNGAFVGSNYQIVANGAGSMLECCNYCMKLGSCETFMFREGTRNCFLMFHQGSTCQSQSNHPNFFMSQSGVDNGAGYQIGNGVCGYTYSGNSDSSPFRVD